MLTADKAKFITTSRTPTNVAADLREVNKRLSKLDRRAAFACGIIQITRISDGKLCAEVWDEAGVKRYIDRLLATYERPYY